MNYSNAIAIMADLQPQGDRLPDFERQLNAALGELTRRGVRYLAIAGDVFETANIGDSHAGTGAVINAVCVPLAVWLAGDRKRQIIAIRGNHDCVSDGPTDALAALETIGDSQQVQVVREPAVLTAFGIAVACLPWRWNVADGTQTASAELDRLIDDASQPEYTPVSLLLAHAPTIGASGGQGRAYQGGGAWSLTRQDCERAGVFFDRVALGDFHLRQPHLCGTGKGGYVGALWQMNFAHVDEPQGFEIWCPESGEVEWIELTAAPTHHVHTVKSADDLDAAVGEEMARLVGPARRVWIKAEGFTPSRSQREMCAVVHARLSVANAAVLVERVARVESAPALAAAGDLAGLLSASLGTLSPKPSDETISRQRALLAMLIDEQPALLRAGKLVDDSGGQPTRTASPRLLEVALRGFARHAEPVRLDFQRLAPLVAIVGRNGVGKTSTVGGLLAALYGTLPGYRGSLYEATTAGGDGEAWVEATFTVPDAATGRAVTYKARREVRLTDKTGEQERYLYRVASDGTEAIVAGPKEGPFRVAVENLVGSPETAMATWFLAGSREGDLVELSPKERRAALGSLMGLDVLEAIADAAGDEAKARAAQVKLSAQALPSVAACEATLAQASGAVESGRAALASATATVEVSGAELRRIGAEIYAAKQARADVSIAEGNLAIATRAIDAARAEESATAAQLDLIAGKIAGARELVSLAADMPGLEARLSDAKAKRATLSAWSTWDRKRQDAATIVDERERALETEKARLDATEKRVADEAAGKPTLLEMQAAGVALKETETKLAREVETLRGSSVSAGLAHARADAEVGGTAARLAELERRAAKAPVTPFGADACAPCPLMAQWAQLPVDIASTRQALAEAGERVRATKAEIDTAAQAHTKARADLDAATQAVNTAREQYRARLDSEREIERMRDGVGTLAHALLAARELMASIVATEPERVGDSAEVEREIAAIESAMVRARDAKSAVDALPALESKRELLAAALVECKTRMAGCEAAAISAKAAVDALPVVSPEAIAELERKRATLDSQSAIAQGEVNALSRELGAAESRHETAAKALESARLANDRHEVLKAEETDWRLLALAMGPTGAQGIVIEAASIDFEREASAIVSRLLDRPLTITLAMQMMDAGSKRTNGECRILMAEAGTPAPRELAQWSGGERDAAAIAIRLAIARWVAATRSLALRSLFVDEVAARMHPDVAGRLVEMLAESIADGRLDQVVAITPNPVLAARMPSRIELEAGPLGLTIPHYQGAGA